MAKRQPIPRELFDERQSRPRYHQYYADHEFFSRPPSEERDYLLGLVATDGSIEPRGTVRISLKASDRPLLARVKNILAYSGPILEGSKAGKRQPMMTLGVASKRMVADLAAFGILPRKTWTLRVTGVEDSVPFWRGVIDGDGCITTNKGGIHGTGSPVVCLVGASRDFIEQFAAFVVGRLGGSTESVRHRPPPNPPRNSQWTFCLNGRRAVALLHLLYDDCTIALERKLTAARHAFSWQPVNSRWKDLTADRLLALYQECGTWTAVAASLGMKHLSALTHLKYRRGITVDARGRRPSA